MNGLEKLALLKMDFLGLTTLTLIDDALQADREAPWREDRARGSAARRPADLRDLLQGLHQRRVPVRIAGHARHSAALSAEPHRRPDRAERALPARARSRAAWSTTSSSASTAASAVAVRSAGAEGAARRDLRRHRLSGTGDADLQPRRRLLAGRSRYAAPRHGQEEGRGDGEAARALRQGRGRTGHSRRRRSRRSST